ncbi:MAG: hypothetical protein SGJ19_25505 [Planctomycetia bacterium]|nr:hypothetical protein [Planctomycetia bacterium]
MRRGGEFRRALPWRGVSAALILALGCYATAYGAGLADFVPSDVGICVQAREFTTRARTFLAGPIGQRLLAHHVVQEWRAEHSADLKKLHHDLETHFQMPLAELCDGVAGEEILLGIWPDEMPGRGKGPALLLVRARNSDVLKRAMQALVDEQKKAGKLLAPEQVTAAGAKYQLQVIAPEQDESRLYLATIGDVGILSNSSTLAVKVLELHARAAASQSTDALAQLPSYHAALGRLPAENTVALFVNPRSWDASFDAAVQDADDDDTTRAEHGKWLQAWRGTDYLVGGVALSEEVRFEGAWHARADQLPTEALEVADAVSGRAGFMELVPNNALIAVAGRAQWGRLARLVWGELAAGDAIVEPSRAATGAADVIMQLLERLGPDCGAFVVGAPDKAADKLPIELAFGVETRSRLPRELANTATDTVDQSLRGALAMLTVLYNHDHPQAPAELHTERVDGVPLTTLRGIKELGDVQPTYTMTADGLLVGTSQRAVAQVATIAPADSLARSERVTRVLADHWATPSQVLYIDLRGLCELLARHEGFAHHVMKHDEVPEAEAKRGLSELRGLLGLADTIVAACRVEPGDFAATAHLSAE